MKVVRKKWKGTGGGAFVPSCARLVQFMGNPVIANSDFPDQLLHSVLCFEEQFRDAVLANNAARLRKILVYSEKTEKKLMEVLQKERGARGVRSRRRKGGVEEVCSVKCAAGAKGRGLIVTLSSKAKRNLIGSSYSHQCSAAGEDNLSLLGFALRYGKPAVLEALCHTDPPSNGNCLLLEAKSVVEGTVLHEGEEESGRAGRRSFNAWAELQERFDLNERMGFGELRADSRTVVAIELFAESGTSSTSVGTRTVPIHTKSLIASPIFGNPDPHSIAAYLKTVLLHVLQQFVRAAEEKERIKESYGLYETHVRLMAHMRLIMRFVMDAFVARLFRPDFKQNLIVLEGFLIGMGLLAQKNFFRRARAVGLIGGREEPSLVAHWAHVALPGPASLEQLDFVDMFQLVFPWRGADSVPFFAHLLEALTSNLRNENTTYAPDPQPVLGARNAERAIQQWLRSQGHGNAGCFDSSTFVSSNVNVSSNYSP